MTITSVAVPGPWWTLLSYASENILPVGIRVRVPLGNSVRIGLTAESLDFPNDIKKIKMISDVIDMYPALPEELWKTMNWFGDTWFAGLGMAAKTLLPSKFLEGEPVDHIESFKSCNISTDVKYSYEPRDSKRYMLYEDMLTSSHQGSLAIFPEVLSAKKFWEMLPKSLKDNGVLWPVASPSKQWDIWKRTRTGEIQFVVGSQGASFLPLYGLSKIIVDEEFSGAWRSQKNPVFHRRTLLAARARFAGAELVLGGRMPSSKAFQQCGDSYSKESAANRVVYVDLRDSSSSAIAGVKDSIPISIPLIRETVISRKLGAWVFWVLDRKGYAGEIFCEDCGAPIRCSRCGGVMRWEGKASRLTCLNCCYRIPVPERCPSCGGPFLEGHRPGLEALADIASSLLKHSCGKVLFFQNEGEKIPSGKSLLKDYPDGGVIIGTRKILALADSLDPGMIGWIDADAEARVAEYDAKGRAFALLWESVWRGGVPDKRKIVIQSRRPGKGWQNGIERGWGYFWSAELRERKDWGLPPFVPLIKIQMPKGGGASLSGVLQREGFEYWESEETVDEVWVRTRRFTLLKKILEPYYNIKNTRFGMPCLELNLD